MSTLCFIFFVINVYYFSNFLTFLHIFPTFLIYLCIFSIKKRGNNRSYYLFLEIMLFFVKITIKIVRIADTLPPSPFSRIIYALDTRAFQRGSRLQKVYLFYIFHIVFFKYRKPVKIRYFIKIVNPCIIRMKTNIDDI